MQGYYNIFKVAQDISTFKLPRKKLSLILYSIITGILTGFLIILYRVGLDKVVQLRNNLLDKVTSKTAILVILVFILVALIMQFLLDKFPLISGSGIPQVAGLLQKKVRFNWFWELITKFINGVLAIGCGMSLGREGPSIHLGALLAEGINQKINKSATDEKYILTSGTSAGLAAAFNAPLSGVIFAVEELHKFISPILIVCILLASSASALMIHLVLGSSVVLKNFQFVNTISLNWRTLGKNLLLIFILNIFVLILGVIFNYLLLKLKEIYNKIKINRYIKMMFMVFVSLMVVLFFPAVTGGGHDLIETLFFESYTIKFLLVLLVGKLLFTTFSYSSGAAGGIFLPMLVIGALLGKLFGIIVVRYFGFPPIYETMYMLLAMSSFFTSVVKAPITGIILILEMTGNFSNLFLLTISSGFAYVLTEIFKLTPVYELLFDAMFSKLDKENKEPKSFQSRMVTYKIPVTGDSYVVGKKLKDVTLPKNLLIIGIERKGKDFIPNGDTILQPSDIIIIFTDELTAKYNIHLINKIMKVDKID